ncbi:MAG: ECF transporter S component [Defluviitaleaceae bacterium]|nr:ECF transporter S component [Defluviitaleaceae bacterium]
MTKKITTTIMVRAALLGAIAAVLMQFGLRMPIFPGFLSLDIGDLPALIGAITTGPLTGLLTLLIKNLINPIIFGTNTGGIGNFADFVMGAALILPIGIIFKKRKDNLGYIIGSAAGLVCLTIVASIMNYFVLIPLFSRIFMPMERILELAYAVNSNVTSLSTLILFAIIPFNLLKGTAVLILGFIIYKYLAK